MLDGEVQIIERQQMNFRAEVAKAKIQHLLKDNIIAMGGKVQDCDDDLLLQ